MLAEEGAAFLPSCFWSTAAVWFLETRAKVHQGHSFYRDGVEDGVCERVGEGNHLGEPVRWYTGYDFALGITQEGSPVLQVAL